MKIAIAAACIALTTIPAPGVFAETTRAGGRVVIAHGPLANIGMPAMTMTFRVKEAVWLEQLKEGDRIRFVADNVKGSLTVVQLDRAN